MLSAIESHLILANLQSCSALYPAAKMALQLLSESGCTLSDESQTGHTTHLAEIYTDRQRHLKSRGFHTLGFDETIQSLSKLNAEAWLPAVKGDDWSVLLVVSTPDKTLLGCLVVERRVPLAVGGVALSTDD